MKNLYSRSLIFSLALIFVFAVAVPAQQKKTTTKKNTSSKTTKKAPVLKPGVTGANKTAKSAPKTTAIKTPAKADSSKVVAASKTTAKADPKPTPAKTPVKVTEKVTEKTTIKSKAPEEEEIASVPSKTWLPSVTADTIKKDISGRGISDIPSEAGGDGAADWLFAANQTRDIEVLKKTAEGSELVVETRINAKKTKANADGTYDRLRGVARLVYRRGERNWELNRVENVSLRHGDTGMDNPVTPVKTTNTVTPTLPPTTAVATVIPKPTPTPVPPPPPITVIPGSESVTIPAGKYQSYSFRVPERAVATGRFQAAGGSRNDIEAYILDYDGFLNWTNDHGSPAFYNSGRMTVGNINTLLGPGSYYLVLNNRISPDDAKTVAVSLQLRMDPATLAGVEYGGNYNGAGLGSGSRRVYLPLAAPAPAYSPDPDTVATNRPAQNIPSATSRPVVSEVAGYTSESVLSDTFNVEDRKFQAFAFTVRQGGMVKGSFRVVGGGSNGNGVGNGREIPNIEAFIMTADQYAKWSSYREATVNYTSGRVTNGGISRTLQPGNYYLVFSNYYSTRDSKTIQAEVHVEYLPK